jgi:hypothetical protein
VSAGLDHGDEGVVECLLTAHACGAAIVEAENQLVGAVEEVAFGKWRDGAALVELDAESRHAALARVIVGGGDVGDRCLDSIELGS